tara:strand:+ start:336 stop:506 length:171 start_codon:yes stop_codon:yes gene_type:complete
VKLVKVVEEEMLLTKRLVLKEEKVDHLEKLQILVVLHNLVLVLVVVMVQQFVKQLV